ncbi:peptide chain release factor N(5)-glutamine methyltransferase [Fundicoccus sp. Sow4_H7]|uniref:peptide chain release factor N(5)-glutamine methyltransferase n=1 Tax=Fundicoccus sp. Sow4_H7 TaxID=3438784 RepID=UPI003F8F62BB
MDHKSSQTLHEALHRASIFLEKNKLDPNLARTYWMLSFDLSLTDVVKNLHQPVLSEDWQQFETILNRLAMDEPIQYILGYTEFMGERFKVTTDTLIPREETSGIIELAHDLLSKNPQAKVLDIGTGTGILAIMIKKKYPQTSVKALDISKAALAVAKENAAALNVDVEFVQSDLLNAIADNEKFDLILSNPPYISSDELALMDESVKKYEPSLALFAEENGLGIYQRLASNIAQYLQAKGQLIFEIGFRQGEAVKQIFEQAFPKAKVEVLTDFNQLDRYVWIHEM